MRIQIEHNIDIEIRCPRCNNAMSVANKFKHDDTHIVIELELCEYCKEEDARQYNIIQQYTTIMYNGMGILGGKQMSGSVGFRFICDKCHYTCLLVLHYSGELGGYQCPHCKKYFEINNKE